MTSISYTAKRGYFFLGDEVAAWGGYTSTSDLTTTDPDDTDNSYDLSVNGTLSRAIVATNSELVGVSGYSASNYLSLAYNAAFDPGTNPFTVMFWIRENANSSTEVIMERDSSTTAQRYTIQINSSGFLEFTCDDNTTARTATSATAVDDGDWHFVVCVYTAGTLYIVIDAIIDATETGTALLTLSNASAVIRWGLNVAGANPLSNGSLALRKIRMGVTSLAEIKAIYNSEKVLFQKDRVYTRYGAVHSFDLNSVQALSRSYTDIYDRGESWDGTTETLYHRQDRLWSLRTDWMLYNSADFFQRFLDSLVQGGTFQFDPYGTIASPYEPVSCYLESSSHKENVESVKYISFDITIREKDAL